MLEKTFGEIPLPQAEVYHRTGAYGVIFNNKEEIAVVKVPMGYFLLGGGLEGEETHQDCIRRECIEEAGLDVAVGDFICKSDMYIWSDTYNKHLHGIGYFYHTTLVKEVGGAIEEDHQLVWLAKDCCPNELFQAHQAWAVKQAIKQRED